MANTKKKLLMYKILIVILIIIAIIIVGIITQKQYKDQVYDKENLELVGIFHKEQNELKSNNSNNNSEEKKQQIELKYKGYNVIGLIEIPAIELEYPILEKTTKTTMATSISRFSGGIINGYGNVSLAGHNNYSGTMFGKNKDLKINDKILLTDLFGTTLEYEIYDIFVTDPNDTSILETKDERKREVTLITCKSGRAERLIIKAREILK